MHILSLTDISVAFGPEPLLSWVSLGIDSQDRIGLIGDNGSGKSTLAKILAGTARPGAGVVTVAGGVTCHYLPQQPEFSAKASILTEVFRGKDPALQALHRYYSLGEQLADDPSNKELAANLAQASLAIESLGAWELAAKGQAALSRLGVTDTQRSVAVLSGGEKKRVALARALITPAQLLILDEPTNHLDAQAILWLEDYLLKLNGALILITHDRRLLQRVANRILALEGGQVLDCAGGYQAYLELRAQRQEAEAAAARRHRAALRRELAWMLQGAQGRSTKEKARKKLFRELNRQTGPVEKGQVQLEIPASRLGKKVIELEGISKSLGGRTLIQDFSYILLPRARIGIVGANGSGKTTLLNIIAGQSEPDQGAVSLGETVKIGYYRQQAEALNPELRVIQYIQGIRYSINTAAGSISAEKMLERFLFFGAAHWTLIRDLSGGERQRLYLLGVLMTEPNVLLLDEPTNNLDIETLTVLEDYLADFPGAVLAVSHDRWFLDKTMDQFLVLSGTGAVGLYAGSFEQYLAEAGRAPVGPERPLPAGPKDPPVPRQKTKLSYKEQQEWQRLEQDIDQLQEQLTELQEELNASGGADYQRLAQLHQETVTLEARLEEKMERWLALQELKDMLEASKTPVDK